ncbi:MAG: hypothetical protein IPL46_35455 [Saprospiraceae bacterium]|nr:hypothetical protein [Saprospiraceae bacterium]
MIQSQVLIDDFETDTDLTNWENIEGLAEVQGADKYSGALAIRLHQPDLPPDAQTTYLHKTFLDNFGIYEMACFADGPVSDVQFIFQYIDPKTITVYLLIHETPITR